MFVNMKTANISYLQYVSGCLRIKGDFGTGEYFTRKSIFCQGLQQCLSFFAEEIFGNFLTKFPHFWTICNKNAKFWIIWQNIGNIMIKSE